jgi:hypothetical protein
VETDQFKVSPKLVPILLTTICRRYCCQHRLPSTSLWVPVGTSLGTTRTTSHVSYEKGIDSEFPS